MPTQRLGPSSGEDAWWEDTPYLRGIITVGIVERIEFFFSFSGSPFSTWSDTLAGSSICKAGTSGGGGLGNRKSLSRDGCRCNDVESHI